MNMRTLLNIDEEVNPISNLEDAVAFIMEISSFLKRIKYENFEIKLFKMFT
jgi:hypothetical protein